MATAKKNHAEVIQGALMVALGKDPRKFNTVFLAAYPDMQRELGPGGGEEMMRLRAYEQLQKLHTRGTICRSRLDGSTVYTLTDGGKS